MAYFKRPTGYKGILYSPWSALVVIFLIFFVGYGVVSVIGKSMDAAESRKRAEELAVTTSEKEARLTKKIQTLQTPDGQEAALREQFPVVREGEQLILIVDEKETVDPNAKVKTSGFKTFWKNLFE